MQNAMIVKGIPGTLYQNRQQAIPSDHCGIGGRGSGESGGARTFPAADWTTWTPTGAYAGVDEPEPPGLVLARYTCPLTFNGAGVYIAFPVFELAGKVGT
jgi:hypothetical protein